MHVLVCHAHLQVCQVKVDLHNASTSSSCRVCDCTADLHRPHYAEDEWVRELMVTHGLHLWGSTGISSSCAAGLSAQLEWRAGLLQQVPHSR